MHNSSIDQLNKKSKCLLFENCVIKSEINEEYVCKSSPWEIIKHSKYKTCIFGMASLSFGFAK